MKSSVLIEIEHTKYIRLINLETQTSNEALLTTVKKGQKRAIIKLIGKREGKTPIQLSEYEIAVPHEYQSGEIRPKIHVKASVWEKRMDVSGYLDRKEVFSDSIHIGKLLPGPNWKPVAGIIGAVAAVVLLLALIMPRYILPDRSQSPSSVRSGQNDTRQGISSSENSEKSAPEASEPKQAGNMELATDLEDMENDTGNRSSESAEASTATENDSRETEEESPMPVLSIPDSDISRNVYFAPNSSVLDGEAKQVLSGIADLIKEYSDASVQIWGHCAVRGTEEGREKLSEERAANVKEYFVSMGAVPVEFNVQGFAGTKPVTMEEDKQYLNRRVEITILSE